MYVDLDKLQVIIDRLSKNYKSLSDIFATQDNGVKLIEDSNMWHGTACENAIIKYRQLTNSYNVILNNLKTQIDFLQKVKENYLAQENKIINDTNNL